MFLAPAPAYVGVSLDDRGVRYRLTALPHRVRVPKHGKTRSVQFVIQNYGMDPHNFAIKRVGAHGAIRVTPALIAAATGGRPGVARLRVNGLPPGSYSLYCTIGLGTPQSHAARGMRQGFVVLAAKRG